MRPRARTSSWSSSRREDSASRRRSEKVRGRAGEFEHVRRQESETRAQNCEGPDHPCRAVHHDEPACIVASSGARLVDSQDYKAPGRISKLSACDFERLAYGRQIDSHTLGITHRIVYEVVRTVVWSLAGKAIPDIVRRVVRDVTSRSPSSVVSQVIRSVTGQVAPGVTDRFTSRVEPRAGACLRQTQFCPGIGQEWNWV